MKKKLVQLIHYLMEQTTPTPAKELAAVLDSSIRSVKNYIRELNLIAGEKLIRSSNQGYCLNKELAGKLLAQKDEIPQTSDERINYIVKRLCIEHASSLDIYDMCDTLYVSYSTLKADIGKMNRTLSDFHVQFVVKNDRLSLKGKEQDKRKLTSHVIYEETGNNFTDAAIIKSTFRHLDVDGIESIIRSTFQKHSYYLNDFSFINLLLHFTIIINRIKNGNHTEDGSNMETGDAPAPHKTPIVEELCQSFEKRFQINLTDSDRREVALLVKTNANYMALADQNILQSAVGDDIYQLASDLLRKVNETYHIDIYSDSFFTPFALHLEKLLIRAKNRRYSKNPMTQTIKTSYPTIYDIAIFISLQLMERYHIQVVEDEVAFIALHVGAEIERRSMDNSKIKCVLYCPDYVHIGNQLYNQLLLEFSGSITVIKIISTPDRLPREHFDLLIATVSLNIPTAASEILVVPPFLQRLHKARIYDVINKLQQDKQHSVIKKHFDSFFSDDLFLTNPRESTREEIIHKLCQMLKDKELVDETFECDVLERENAASTAFGSIAIPHSVKMEAVKSSIAAAVYKDGLTWNGHKVYLVLMIAINKGTRQLFYELYESLVELFSDDGIIRSVQNCGSFDDFRTIIYQNIINYREE